MASEGSREIEAARQRLATATMQAASAAKMMESAKAMSEAAEKEVKAAAECLKGAEKRWEVIDVDSDDESQEMESSKKRRKVSLSPGLSNGDADAVRQNIGTAVSSVEGPSTTPRTVLISCTSGAQDHWGHTVVGANGTYQQTDEKEDGVPMYRKDGFWNGDEVDFIMYRGKKSGTKYWFIGVSGCTTLFRSCFPDTDLPPQNCWIRMNSNEMMSTPSVKNAKIPSCMKVSKIEVEGSGIKEVNGTYEQEYSIEGGRRRIGRLEDGVPLFIKMGVREGKPAKFMLVRGQGTKSKKWVICGPDIKVMYAVRCSANAQVPPIHGWVVRGNGVHPAPNLKWVNDE